MNTCSIFSLYLAFSFLLWFCKGLGAGEENNDSVLFSLCTRQMGKDGNLGKPGLRECG